MQQIILNPNLERQNDEIKKVNSFCTKINAVLPEFEKETGYKLNMNEVIMLFERNELDELIDNVNRSIESGLKGIRITGIIRKTFTANTAEIVYSFGNKMKRLLSLNSTDYLRQLSMENGLLCLSKDQEQAIREKFIVAIKTDGGKEFYELHLAAAKSLSDLLKFVKANTRIEVYYSQQIGNLFALNNATGEVSTGTHIGYDYAVESKNLSL